MHLFYKWENKRFTKNHFIAAYPRIKVYLWYIHIEKSKNKTGKTTVKNRVHALYSSYVKQENPENIRFFNCRDKISILEKKK